MHAAKLGRVSFAGLQCHRWIGACDGIACVDITNVIETPENPDTETMLSLMCYVASLCYKAFSFRKFEYNIYLILV